MSYSEIKVVMLQKLKNGGFDGLLAPDECACEACDLMPCGEADLEDGAEWVNDCQPGYRIGDPSGKTNDFVMTTTKREVSQEDFDRIVNQI